MKQDYKDKYLEFASNIYIFVKQTKCSQD